MIFIILALIINFFGIVFFGIDYSKDFDNNSFSKFFFFFLVILFIIQLIMLTIVITIINFGGGN